MKRTKEQLEIIELAKAGVSFGIDAGAGCGKTSTAKMIVESLPAHLSIFVCSFSNAITNSIREAMKGIPNCSVATLHSCGRKLVGKCTVDGDKVERITKGLYRVAHGVATKQSSHYKALIGYARDQCISEVTADMVRGYQKEQMLRNASFLWEIDDDSVAELCNDIVKYARKEADDCVIDFHDMLEVNVRRKSTNTVYDVVIVDEFQDSNPLQIAFLRSLNAKQYIVTYDPLQRLFGFAGAVTDCRLEAEMHLGVVHTLPLITSFRCSNAIAKSASVVKSGFKAFDGNREGSISVSRSFPQVTDAILARTNKDVLSVFVDLVVDGRRCSTPKLGNILAKTRIILSWCDSNNCSVDFWRESELEKLLHDVVDMEERKRITLRVTEDAGLADFIVKKFPARSGIESLEKAMLFFDKNNSSESDVTQIMTIHSSKGLEWADVTIIDYSDVFDSSEDSDCLYYVAITRAKNNVTIVSARNRDDAPVVGLIESYYLRSLAVSAN